MSNVRRGQSFLSRWGIIEGFPGLFLSDILQLHPKADFKFSVGESFKQPYVKIIAVLQRRTQACVKNMLAEQFDLLRRRLIAVGAPKESWLKQNGTVNSIATSELVLYPSMFFLLGI